MKAIAAVDSFKGSMSSMEAGMAVREGILSVLSDAEVVVKPVADGGEGTTEALAEGLGGELVHKKVHGPLEAWVDACYGIIPGTKTAVMEMAAAAGITLTGDAKRPLDATTYGVGELIKDAIERGCRDFLIGIGGSATNDGGIGMLSALGFEFLDSEGRPAGIGASALAHAKSIRTEHVLPELKDCRFRIACDVTNPLCGPNGATYIYGPQKGVSGALLAELDTAMAKFARMTRQSLGTDFSGNAGAGAAGGLGFAFLSYLHGDLKPGIELVLEAVGMEKALEGADLVFTGEGCLDHQTPMGKTPAGVAKLAKKHHAKVVALGGAVLDGAKGCHACGIDAYFPIIQRPMTLDEAMDTDTAKENIAKTAAQVVRLLYS